MAALRSKFNFEPFAIDKGDTTPQYLQLANFIRKLIRLKKLPPGHPLPSINELTDELDISRDTGVRAYKELKRTGDVGSVQGKGYFIAKTALVSPPKICVVISQGGKKDAIMDDSVISALPVNTDFSFYAVDANRDFLDQVAAAIQKSFTHYIFIFGNT